MKKKGFTLIELLAVIVILAVIALIATPIIIDTIEMSRKNSFKQTVHAIIKTIELDYITNVEPKNLLFKDYNFPNSGLKFKGKSPEGGFATVDKDGEIAIAVFDSKKKYCAVKTKDDSDIRVITDYKKCDADVAENLLANGYGEYGDNTDLSKYTYKDGVFSFKTSSNTTLYSDHKIKVDPNYTYEISLDARIDNPSAAVYMGIVEYNNKEGRIHSVYYMYVANTLTTLKKDLKNGDTVVYLDSISNFDTSNIMSGVNYYRNGFIIWNYKNYPELTFSKNSYPNLFMADGINKVDHTITLTKPWDKGNIPAGTKLSQRNDGANYNYGLLNNGSVPSSWKHYSNTISGTIDKGYNDNQKFRPTTDYISLMVMVWPNTSVTMDIKNIVIKRVD